jgi:hypothetical protein
VSSVALYVLEDTFVCGFVSFRAQQLLNGLAGFALRPATLSQQLIVLFSSQIGVLCKQIGALR